MNDDPKAIFFNYEKTASVKLQQALALIHERLRTTKPGNVLRVPDYHFFRYKGFECGMVKCLTLNMDWVGYVKKPLERNLQWPSRSVERPFETGIDFQYADGNDTVIGFHTYHVMYDATLMGVQNAEFGPDQIAVKIRNFIDECLRSEGPLEIVIPQLVYRAPEHPQPKKRRKAPPKQK